MFLNLKEEKAVEPQPFGQRQSLKFELGAKISWFKVQREAAWLNRNRFATTRFQKSEGVKMVSSKNAGQTALPSPTWPQHNLHTPQPSRQPLCQHRAALTLPSRHQTPAPRRTSQPKHALKRDTSPVPVATARTTPEGGSSSASLHSASVHPSGPIELASDPSCPSVVNFFTRGVILRLVEREPVIIVINGSAVKDYLQTNLTVRFCRSPPHSVRKVVPTNSWVVRATSVPNAINVAKEIKSVVSLAADNNDREPDIKVRIRCKQ